MGKFGALFLYASGAVLLALLVWRWITPDLPVSEPVTVRGGSEERPLSTAVKDFDPSQIVTVLSKDAIPAIDDPKLVPGEEADLDEDELVIGVEVAGEARAYPTRVLSSHEIVNDEVRGHPFAVTW